MHKPWYSFLYIKSPIVKILVALAAILASLAVVVFQLGIEEKRMAAQTGNWEGRSIEKGAEVFANNCSNCHGPDGKGLPGVAPALHSKYFFLQRLQDVSFTGSLKDYVAGTVAAGRPSKVNSQWAQKMPTWGSRYGGPLRDDQVQQVTAFVLNWEKDALLQGTPDNPDPWQPFQDAPSKAPGGVVEAPAAAPVSEGPRDPEVLFSASASGMACIGCHVLTEPQTGDNRGAVGPNMANLAENAANRVAGEDAATYVHNSIVNPGAYVVEGYANGIMPQNFATRMSEEEINNLVAWLLDPNRGQ